MKLWRYASIVGHVPNRHVLESNNFLSRSIIISYIAVHVFKQPFSEWRKLFESRSLRILYFFRAANITLFSCSKYESYKIIESKRCFEGHLSQYTPVFYVQPG